MPTADPRNVLREGNREQRTLIALSMPSGDIDLEDLHELLSDFVNWPIVLSGAMQHRTLSMLWENLRTRDLMSAAIRSGLTKNWIFYADTLSRASIERNRLWMGLVDDLAVEFERADIPLVAIKGSALIGDIYHVGNRMLGDVDTLVPRRFAGDVIKFLDARGFQQGQIDPVTSEIVPMPRAQKRFWTLYAHALPKFTFPTGDDRYPFLRFAVGFDFFDPTDEYSYPCEPVIERRVRKASGGALFVPDEFDTVICLCAHIYREATSANFAYAGENWHLWKFCDLRQTLLKPQPPEFRNALRDRIVQAGLQIPYYFAVYYTQCVYGTDLRQWLDLIDVGDDLSFLRVLIDGNNRYEDTRPFNERLFDAGRVRIGQETPVWANVMAQGEWW